MNVVNTQLPQLYYNYNECFSLFSTHITQATRITQRPSTLCWYHHRLGEDAKKCQPPCTWTGNEQANH